jgi:hypothetical protein
MDYTPRELEVFRYCFQLIADGCKSSFEAERALRVKFWWATHLDAERLLKRFWRERSKIEGVLGLRARTSEIQNVRNLSQSTLAPGDPCCATP